MVTFVTIITIAFVCIYCISNNVHANKNPPPFDQRGGVHKCDGVTCDDYGQCASTAGKHQLASSKHGCYGSKNEKTGQVSYTCHTVQSTVCDKQNDLWCGSGQECLSCEPEHRTRYYPPEKCCYTKCVVSCEKDQNGKAIESTCVEEHCPHARQHPTQPGKLEPFQVARRGCKSNSEGPTGAPSAPSRGL